MRMGVPQQVSTGLRVAVRSDSVGVRRTVRNAGKALKTYFLKEAYGLSLAC